MTTATDDRPLTEEEQLELDIAGFERDPYGYAMYAFPWGEPGTELATKNGPRKWQTKILQRIRDELRKGTSLHTAIQVAVCSGHGIGKSALIAMVCKWALDTHEDTKIVITANTEKQLNTKTSPELAKWNRLSITSHWFSDSVTALKSTDPAHEKTWRADLIPWSEHNTEAFAGLHNEGKRVVLLMDEGSAIADKVWEVAEGALTDANTQILWLVFGNGTRSTGRFRECFRRFKHRWIHEQIDSRTVEDVNLEQLNKQVEDWGEDSDLVKVRIRGMFPSAAGKQFIDQKDVDAAYGRIIRVEEFTYAPKILTVDPAWGGGSEFVVGLRQGLVYRTLRTLPRNDDDVAMANMIARLEDEELSDAVFIDFGYGTGIVSIGRTLGRDWILVPFGGAADEPGAHNKRAAMYMRGKKWLKEGGCLPKDPILSVQLTSIETVPRLDDKILLEPKEAMETRGLDSPDRADAWALSFAHPVVKKDRGPLVRAGSGRPGHASIAEYNPLDQVDDPFEVTL